MPEGEQLIQPPAPPAPSNQPPNQADVVARKIMELIAAAYDVAVELAVVEEECVKKSNLYIKAKELVQKVRELRDIQSLLQKAR